MPFPHTLLSGPQQIFCYGLALGLTARDAYRRAYPDAGPTSLNSAGCVLSLQPHIQAELRRLRARAAALAGPGVLTHTEKRVFLARIVRCRVPDIALHPDSEPDLINGFIPRPPRHGPQLLFPSKLAAISIDNDLARHGYRYTRNPRRDRYGHFTDLPPPPATALDQPAPLPPPVRLCASHQKFCAAIVAGMNGRQAYLHSHPRCNPKNAAYHASPVWRKPHIRAEIQRLRDAAELLPGSPLMSLLEKRLFLARIVRLHVLHIDPVTDADLIKRIIPTPWGPRYILYSKLAAIRLDNHLAGHVLHHRPLTGSAL